MGQVPPARGPPFRTPRAPAPPRRPRTARFRQRDDQRARRALRHVADRDEETHPAARGCGARDHREGRPCPQMHACSLRFRGHQYVAAAARSFRAGRRTYERRPMSTTQKQAGFSADEKAAMRASAKELKAAAERETAGLDGLAKMTPSDRALGKRIHAIVTEAAPDLVPKTWYGMPAYARDGKVVVFFRDAAKFKERYAMLGFNDSAKLDEGSMWPIAFALKKLTAADEAKIRALVKKAVR